jgi:uncharacterized protein
MNKIAITGATGFIGRRLAVRFSEEGYKVTAFTRDAVKGKKRLPGNVNVMQLDYNKPLEWEEEINSSEAVIHLAGANLFSRRWDDEYKKKILESRENSTRTISKSIKKNSTSLKLLISASAIGYYGETDSIGVDEKAPAGNDFLAHVCKKWEEPTYIADEKGVRRINMRMGLILSTEDGYLNKLLPGYKMFVGGPLGSGSNWVSWIHIDDVVEAYLYAVKNDSLSGPVNLTAPEPVTMKHFSSALGNELGRPSFFKVPEFAIKIIVGEGGEYVVSSQKVFPEKLKRCGFNFRFSEIEPALNDLIKNKK